MYTKANIQLYQELLKEAEEKVAIDPSVLSMLLHGAAGGAAVGIPTYLLTRAHDEGERLKTRNRAFGAGVATGFAGPQILRGLLGSQQPEMSMGGAA